MKEVGLFFGTFNPFHNGHLFMANYFLNECIFDEIWLVISPQNPLKKKPTPQNKIDTARKTNKTKKTPPRRGAKQTRASAAP